MIRLYNTLSEKKEPLPDRRPLRLFVCGITPYNTPHIGNAHTFMIFDVAVKYLRSRGVEVSYIQNVTDLDDKIIARAAAEGVTWQDIARKYEDVYHKDMEALGIDAVDEYARATDHIPEIVRQVKALIDKGHAYKIEDDGWYFDLSTFPEYGKLAHRTAEAAEDATTRIDASEKKRNRGDFCVWKFSPPAGGAGEPAWEAEIGSGRPGWHIEDTAITEHFFGPQYEIHGGAVDLKFPHHEAEIAQQESASGLTPFVQVWMHAGFLLVNGQKMSKSLGNFITIEELLARHSGEEFRMLCLSHHYRSPVDYTEALAKQAAKNLGDLRLFAAKLAFIEEKGSGGGAIDAGKYAKLFEEAMDDDLNTPQALAALFELMAEANKDIWNLSKENAREARLCVSEALKTWGFKDISLQIPPAVMEIAAKREEARRNKQFIPADAFRKQMEELGYSGEDTPLGPFLRPKGK